MINYSKETRGSTMTINPNNSIYQFNIDQLKDLRLFVVEEKMGLKGKIYVIQRVKFNNDDTVDKIRMLKEKLETGKIWHKTGSKRTNNIKYAGRGLNPSQIEQIILKKAVVDAEPIETEIIRDGMTAEDKIKEMDEEEERLFKFVGSLLEKIENASVDKFQKSAQKSSHLVQQTPAKIQVKSDVTRKEKVSKESSQREYSPQESAKKRAIQQEKDIDNTRIKKRKTKQIAEESDTKAAERLKKDIRSEENQQEVEEKDRKRK